MHVCIYNYIPVIPAKGKFQSQMISSASTPRRLKKSYPWSPIDGFSKSVLEMNYSTGRFSSGFLSGLLFFTIYLLWVEIVLYSSASIIKYLVNIHLLLDTVPCASKKLVGTLTSHSIQRCIYQIFQHWYTRIQFYPLSQSRIHPTLAGGWIYTYNVWWIGCL